MSLTPKSENECSLPPVPDVVDVIDRVAHIENIINQIILGYCKPRQEAREFMWSIVLDTSIMSLGAKVKVITSVSQKIAFKLNRDSLHKVIALRNAFAHHASNAHPVIVVGSTPEEDTNHLELWVLESTGNVTHKTRDKALMEFNAAYLKAHESLVQLLKMVHEMC